MASVSAAGEQRHQMEASRTSASARCGLFSCFSGFKQKFSSNTSRKSSAKVASRPATPCIARVTKSEAQDDVHTLYCPVCCYFFNEVYQTSCCKHQVCGECLSGYFMAKGQTLPGMSPSSPVHMKSIDCLHCAASGLVASVITGTGRRYEDSPAVSKLKNKVVPTMAGPSPLKVGDSYEKQRQKMIMFGQPAASPVAVPILEEPPKTRRAGSTSRPNSASLNRPPRPERASRPGSVASSPAGSPRMDLNAGQLQKLDSTSASIGSGAGLPLAAVDTPGEKDIVEGRTASGEVNVSPLELPGVVSDIADSPGSEMPKEFAQDTEADTQEQAAAISNSSGPTPREEVHVIQASEPMVQAVA